MNGREPMNGREQRVGLLTAARRVQAAGRMGDSVLAHISPDEARLLDRVTDGGSVNPHTGLLEFWDAGSAGDGHGTGGGSSIGGGGPSASGKGGENAAHGETQGTTAGRDAGYGGGWGGSGGNDGGNGGGGSADPGSLGPSSGSVAAPSGGLGSGLGTGSLGALNAATSPSENDQEPGSGLAGIDVSSVTSTTPGVTQTAAEAQAQADFGFGQSGMWGADGKWGNPGYTGYAGLEGKGFTPDGLVTVAGINYGAMFDETTGKIENTFGFSPSRGLLSVGGAIPGIGPAISLGSTVASIAGQLPNDWSPMTGSPAQSAPPGSNGGDPNPYAQSLGVDSADMQRRGLLNQRRTFTPIRMG